MRHTLGTRLQERDAAAFVGRTDELRRLEPRLAPDSPGGVALVHGPPGVGKSALLRELARRGAAAGRGVVRVEARDVAPIPEALDDALAPALVVAHPLVLLDSWERLTSLDSHLREVVLPMLPAESLVVIASRRAPGRAWFSGGWERLATDEPLAPLGASEADALLRALGVEDPLRRAGLVSWAGGSPLALVLGAEAPDLSGPAGDPPPRLADALLRQLLDAQPDAARVDVLAVAALARVTTPRLLAAALTGADGDEAFAWLRRRAFAEPLGAGVTLHDLVGRALRADLRRRAPERERDLRRRIADALYDDATAGGLLALTLDLQHLVRDPAIRWGFAWDASGRLRIDAVAAAELAELAADGPAVGWHADAAALHAAAPHSVVGVRDLDDALAGYALVASPANAPAQARDDPLLGPRLAHAAEHVRGGAAFVCRQAVDLTGTPGSTVMGVLGIASVLGSGLDNPSAAYLSVARGDATGSAFTAACGARRVEELTAELHGATVECHVIDYGDGGLLGFQRAAVYRELGLAPPRRAHAAGADPELVRDALRDFGSPAGLAASPLATAEGTPAARATALAERIEAAVERAFGESDEDRALRETLERGYLHPAATHECAAEQLGLSRAAYFRRLRRAVERVSAELED